MTRGEPRALAALAGSFLLHLAVVLLAGAGARHAAVASERTAQTRESADRWGGNTFEVDDLLGAQQARTSGESAVAPGETGEPAATPGEPQEPAAHTAPAAPAEPKPDLEPAPSPEPTPSAPAPSESEPAASDSKPGEPEPAASDSKPGEPEPAAGDAKPGEANPARPAASGPPGDSAASYGASGLPPGVRSLAKAFTRAIPAATNLDPAWAKLPIGAAGEARVVLEVDDDGRLTRVADGADAPEPPRHLGRLLDRVLLMLKTGRFALSRADRNAGRETLRLEVVISQRDPSDDDFADPADTVELGFEPPTLERPGRAFFKKASGRYIEIRVSIENSG